VQEERGDKDENNAVVYRPDVASTMLEHLLEGPQA
jgi:hypothetical protein